MEAFSQIKALFPHDPVMGQVDKNKQTNQLASAEREWDIYEDQNQPLKNKSSDLQASI